MKLRLETSYAFKGAQLSILSKETNDRYNLYCISYSGDTEYYYLREYTSALGIASMIQEISNYSTLAQNPALSEALSIGNIYLPFQKIAIGSEREHAQCLQPYCGPTLCKVFKDLLNNALYSVGDFYLKMMKILMREICYNLLYFNIIHGNLSPDSITYDPFTGKIYFLEGMAIKTLANKSLFHSDFVSRYFALLDYDPNGEPNESVVKAEIKVIALIFYEIAINYKNDSTYMHLYDCAEMFIDNKHINQNALAECSKGIFSYSEATYYKGLLLEMLNGTVNYSTILTTLSKDQTISNGYLSQESNFNSYPFSIDLTSIGVNNRSEVTIKKYNHSTNIFYVEPSCAKYYNNSLPLVVKRATTDSSYQKELTVFNHLRKFKTTTLARAINGLKEENLEIPIEFCGTSSEYILSSSKKDDSIYFRLFNCIYQLLTDLSSTHIFHCDIKFANMSISNSLWIPKLYDYDIAVINPTPNDSSNPSWDQKYTFQILYGYTVEYASPEVLDCIIKKSKPVLNPFRADEYSLGMAIICGLTGNFSLVSILKNVYFLDIPTNASASMITEKIQKEFHDGPNDITTLSLKYFHAHSKNVVSNIYKLLSKLNISLPKVLIDMVEYNPEKRPSLQTIKEELEKCSNKFASIIEIKPIPDAYTYAQPNPDGTFNINCFENQNEAKIYYYPVCNMFQFKCRINKIGGSEILEKKYNYPLYAEFIQCIIHEQLNPKLFMVGGCENGKSLNDTSIYNNAIFYKLTPMNEGRHNFGFISWKAHIAVVGGICYREYSNSLEQYHAIQNRWTGFADALTEPKINCVVTYIAEKLYVIGGIKMNNGNVDKKIYESRIKEHIFSKEVEIFNLRSLRKTACIVIKEQLNNSISQCVCIPIRENEIIIFRSFLTYPSETHDCHIFTLNIGADASLSELKLPNGLDYLAFNAHKILSIGNDTSIVFPDLLETECDEPVEKKYAIIVVKKGAINGIKYIPV